MSNHTGHLGHAHHTAEDRLLTVAEIAAKLRVDQTTVRRWIKHGTLEAVSLPHVGKRQSYRVKTSTFGKIVDAPAEVAV